ncbi:hypothetical protein [Bradyrhizobium sp. AZCC 1693]|uniref:hypothetical protein n=1 Tax=Bradyrhizobium sp. AZCC 1693 TaxID=3117029 RepID=UPI002FF0DCCF
MIKLSVLSNAVFFAAVSIFLVGFYQQMVFHRERKGRAPHLDAPARLLFSTLAMYSHSLSERCRSRKVFVALASAFFLALVWFGLQQTWPG